MTRLTTLALALSVLTTGAAAQTITEDQKLTALVPVDDGELGQSVSIDGDRLVVGAQREDAAYVFRLDGAVWVQEARFSGSDTQPGDFFGRSVAISGDTVIVGARHHFANGLQSGSAYAFTRTGTLWSEEARMEPALAVGGEWFGHAVDVDGDRAAIGAHFGGTGGSAYVFVRSGTTWSEEAQLSRLDPAGGDFYGWAVAISGDTVAVGSRFDDDLASNSGSAYLFLRSGASWNQQAKVNPSNGFASGDFGIGLDLDGDVLVVGSIQLPFGMPCCTGAAYVFDRVGAMWTERQILMPSDGANDDGFGVCVAIDGDRIAVGSFQDDDNGSQSGSAYVFSESNGMFTQDLKLVASDGAIDDLFGIEVDLAGETVVCGSPRADLTTMDEGAVYVFGAVSIFDDFCFGDGGVQPGCTACPCGNEATPGTVGGCTNSSGGNARLLASGLPSVANDTMRIEMEGGNVSTFAVLSSGAARAPANAINPCFGLDSGVQSINFDGLRCAVQNVLRHGSRPTDANGDVGATTNGWGPPNGPAGGLIAQGGFVAGQTRHYQIVYRETAGLVCGTGQNTSNGTTVTFAP